MRCICVCFSYSTHLARTSLSPSIETAGCLFGFALTNTPLGLPSVLRTIPSSGLSLAQACCLAHRRSLQANLTPTRTQEGPNHSTPPSHHSETLAFFNQAHPTALNVSWRVLAYVSYSEFFLFGSQPVVMQQAHHRCTQTGTDKERGRRLCDSRSVKIWEREMKSGGKNERESERQHREKENNKGG